MNHVHAAPAERMPLAFLSPGIPMSAFEPTRFGRVLSTLGRALADRAGFGHLQNAAIPTVDHYRPALTVTGALGAPDALTYMTDSIALWSIFVRSFVFHAV